MKIHFQPIFTFATGNKQRATHTLTTQTSSCWTIRFSTGSGSVVRFVHAQWQKLSTATPECWDCECMRGYILSLNSSGEVGEGGGAEAESLSFRTVKSITRRRCGISQLWRRPQKHKCHDLLTYFVENGFRWKYDDAILRGNPVV